VFDVEIIITPFLEFGVIFFIVWITGFLQCGMEVTHILE